MPEPGPLPAAKNGFITFGSANRGNKITDSLINLWIAVLVACPDSRFIIAGHHSSDPSFIARIKTFCQAGNVELERVTFQGFRKTPAFWSFYHQVDILLDSAPFNGCLTTLDAMWMGVPVITLSGQTIVSRYGHSFNHCLGLDDWVATNRAAYISTARKKSKKLTELAKLRAALRERITASPICDGQAFGGDLERIFAELRQ